jgi:Holliday junction resolvasome RuvABC DNA-binding subunit
MIELKLSSLDENVVNGLMTMGFTKEQAQHAGTKITKNTKCEETTKREPDKIKHSFS